MKPIAKYYYHRKKYLVFEDYTIIEFKNGRTRKVANVTLLHQIESSDDPQLIILYRVLCGTIKPK